MKPCPFCAEPIQEAAIKCRFCNSMLNEPAGGASPAKERALAAPSPQTSLIFEGTPSWKAWFWSYIAASILSLVIVGLVWIAILELRRKGMRYKITDRTIDYEYGILSKRIETVQLWRVQDIDFQQSAVERIFGIANIHVVAADRSTPEVVLRGLPASREIFDKLKDASEYARRQRIVGLME